jgi:HAD superfamily hydrolase (TIGR01509 family)
LGRSAWSRAEALGADATDIARHRRERDRLYQELLEEHGYQHSRRRSRAAASWHKQHAMAIVTTSKKSDFELIHRRRRIVEHMDFVLANGDYARSKPAPDPYLTALQRFQAQPQEALVVEDSERGLRSALAAGIDCVIVANDFVRGQDFSGATACIESLAELPALLEKFH